MKKIFLAFSMMLFITKISASEVDQGITVLNSNDEHIGFYYPQSYQYLDRYGNFKGFVYPNLDWMVADGQHQPIGKLYKTPSWARKQFYILESPIFDPATYNGPFYPFQRRDDYLDRIYMINRHLAPKNPANPYSHR